MAHQPVRPGPLCHAERRHLPGIAVLTGHNGQVNAVAFSPDGKTLATAAAMARSSLWDVDTHQQIGGPLTGHTNQVDAVASARTARPWPPAATTALPGCGAWPPTSRSAAPHQQHQCGRGFCSGPSARTARPWPPATAMARRGCGVWPPISRSASVTPAPLVRSLRWRHPGRQDPGYRQGRWHGAAVGRATYQQIGNPPLIPARDQRSPACNATEYPHRLTWQQMRQLRSAPEAG